ncbi:MAG: hypothetical protein WC799_20955 [Desulfobacteraceae bacterium]
MIRYIILINLFCLFIFPQIVSGAENNYITPVFPIRAREYWRQTKNISELQTLTNLVSKYELASTWLIHYDVLSDDEILKNLPANSEIGLFLEVTRKLAEESFVKYDWENGNWSQADKIFLSGYTQGERRRIIDKSFDKFKDNFGYYPQSYGTWYVDVWSMEYIRDKYGSDIVLGLADQFSTDGYQEWGQYLNLPYFVSKTSALEPAFDESDSTKILKIQWAPRHPWLAYGSTVENSNYSAQVNDYHRQKDLGQTYFRKLLDDILINVTGRISQIVIGIEVGELEDKYLPELDAQFKYLKELKDKQSINIATMQQFNDEYRKLFSSVSPEAFIYSQNGPIKVSWYMSPQMRYGTKIIDGKITLFDLRYYHASPFRDNDQVIPDTRPNLVRLVPAVIDQLVYQNQTEIPGLQAIPTLFPKPTPVPANNVYGRYDVKYPKILNFYTKIINFFPDIIYSRLEGNTYFGLRLGFENILGLRFPKLKLSKFNFKFPVLDNFISLKHKITPVYPWKGKQEFELEPFLKLGSIHHKGLEYGQDSLINPQQGKVIYENSYYSVISP